MRTSSRLVTLVAVGALVFAACGGGDEGDDAIDTGESAPAEVASDDAPSGDEASDADVSASDEASGVGFGEFVSGTIVLGGAEEATYAVDDPAYTFVGAGGCGGSEFGMTINATEADTGYTVFQLGASIDADLSGGETGTFDVEEMSLIAVNDGDLSASRGYEGPGTMSITEHNTGGADSDLDARRMAITLEGALDATGEGDGTVNVSADILWVMGCP